MKKRGISLFAAAVAFFSSLAAPTAFATPILIVPGGAVAAFTPTTSAFTGSLIDSYSMTFSNAFENGTVYEDVYNNGGLLDFYYQIVNNASSSDSLSRITVGNFTGYTTSVDYLLTGGDAPISATRQAVGDSVGFNINNTPGASTDWLEVATNATAVNSTGTIAVLDSLPTSFTSTLDPAAVPEPSTWALLLGGLGLLAFWRIRRRRA